MAHDHAGHQGHDHGNMMHEDHAGHDGHIMHGVETSTAFTDSSPVNYTGSTPSLANFDSLDASGPSSSDFHAGHQHQHSNNGGAGGHDHSSMGMSMAFHFGYMETILFSFWNINSVAGLLGSMVGVFLMSMLYEGLKVFREFLLQRSLHQARASPGNSSTSSRNGLRAPLAGEIDSPQETIVVKTLFRPNPFSWSHIVQTVLHMLQMVISYLLMLIFMTYNVWLCLAVVLGAGCGYYAFGWRKRTIIDINEHCH